MKGLGILGEGVADMRCGKKREVAMDYLQIIMFSLELGNPKVGKEAVERIASLLDDCRECHCGTDKQEL